MEITSNICQVCHQPILSQYYFCPNCGAKINEQPLSTTPTDQALLYFFSIILPMIGFISINKWKGLKYLKSDDPKTKLIGQIALALIIISTIFVIYFAYVLTQKMIQTQLDAINTDFGSL